MVEAKNSVLHIWAPIRADGASGATGYQGPLVLWPVLFVRKGERRGKGGDDLRLAIEEETRARDWTLVCSLVEAHTIRPAPTNSHFT